MSNFLLRVPSADGFECFGPRRFSASRLSHCIRTADHPVINWFSSIKKEIFNCAFFFFGKYLSYNFLTLLCFYNPGNLGPGQFQAPSSQLILNETTGPPKLVKPPKKILKNSNSPSESTYLFDLGWPGGSLVIWQNYLWFLALRIGMIFKASHILFYALPWTKMGKIKKKLDITTVERNLTLCKIKCKNPWFCFNIQICCHV